MPLTLGIIPISAALAAEYTSQVDTSVVQLQTGDTINITDEDKPEAIYVHSGNNIDIPDSGSLSIKFDSSTPSIRGINILDTPDNNLGTGTTIDVNSNATSGSAAIGINMGKNSSLKANALNINVSSALSAIGIDFSGANNEVDLALIVVSEPRQKMLHPDSILKVEMF